MRAMDLPDGGSSKGSLIEYTETLGQSPSKGLVDHGTSHVEREASRTILQFRQLVADFEGKDVPADGHQLAHLDPKSPKLLEQDPQTASLLRLVRLCPDEPQKKPLQGPTQESKTGSRNEESGRGPLFRYRDRQSLRRTRQSGWYQGWV